MDFLRLSAAEALARSLDASPFARIPRLGYDRRVRGRSLVIRSALALGAVIAATAALHALGVGSATTVALTYLLVVLFVASSTPPAVAVGTAVVAALCLNFFFMAPV